MVREPDALSPSDLLTAALARLRRGGTALGGAALAGTVLLQLPATLGCVDATALGADEQADWAQYEGRRDTAMVSYTGSSWSVCRFANTRFGCGSYDLFIKLRVKPVTGANLDWKRVGVVYRTLDDATERTALGYYVATWPGGDEEWHVPVLVSASQKTILFDAWYQDGASHTYVDDNSGELHVVNDGPSDQVVRVEPWNSTVVADALGVHGQISLQLADLDYDKQIELVATKDNWRTVTVLGIGSGPNRWRWVEDYAWSGRERWVIDVDLPGATSELQYAVVYRHGVVNGARTYEFWDNNQGANYHVVRAVP
jgi:hypothetical protein